MGQHLVQIIFSWFFPHELQEWEWITVISLREVTTVWAHSQLQIATSMLFIFSSLLRSFSLSSFLMWETGWRTNLIKRKSSMLLFMHKPVIVLTFKSSLKHDRFISCFTCWMLTVLFGCVPQDFIKHLVL